MSEGAPLELRSANNLCFVCQRTFELNLKKKTKTGSTEAQENQKISCKSSLRIETHWLAEKLTSIFPSKNRESRFVRTHAQEPLSVGKALECEKTLKNTFIKLQELQKQWTIFNGWTKWKSWKCSFSRNARTHRSRHRDRTGDRCHAMQCRQQSRSGTAQSRGARIEHVSAARSRSADIAALPWLW